MIISLTQEQFLEAENISNGSFSPLLGFMNEAEYLSCLKTCFLPGGDIFPIPIILDLSNEIAQRAIKEQEVLLEFCGKIVGHLFPTSIFKWDKQYFCQQVFGTLNKEHAGVMHALMMKETLLSGAVKIFDKPNLGFLGLDLTPAEVKFLIAKNGWTTVAGFQTRNVPHRAHEYLQRVALELVDGLLIHPLVGKKKVGDYTQEAIVAGYRALIQNYFPEKRILLATLTTSMRYAGPREAVFHAIIRRNFGCTHFIVGRDHAGVGNFYKKYEAHDFISEFERDIGIKILKLCGPFYCAKCDGIATEKTCGHYANDSDSCQEISGSMIRQMLTSDRLLVDNRFMREEVLKSLEGIKILIDEP